MTNWLNVLPLFSFLDFPLHLRIFYFKHLNLRTSLISIVCVMLNDLVNKFTLDIPSDLRKLTLHSKRVG